MYGGEI